jgi:hypothetical protein
LAENAAVGEKPEFIALWMVGDAASGEFLIFGVGNLLALYEFRPIINMARLMDSELSVVTCLGERC